MNPLNWFNPAPPRSQTNTAQLAARAVSRAIERQTRIPDGRLSRDPNTLEGVITWFEDQFLGYPNDNRKRIIRVFRYLAERDEDVANHIEQMIAITNTGHQLEYTGDKRAMAQAEDAIKQLERRLYPEGGGLDGLIGNQVRELLIAGASSLEWFPTRNRREVDGVAVLEAEHIDIRRDPDTQAWRHYQTGVAPGWIALHEGTYQYIAARTAGANPYGLPRIISSLEALERKRTLMDGEERIINLMSRMAIVTASLPKPTIEELGVESEADPRYAEELEKYYESVAELIISSSENGLWVKPEGGELEATPVHQSATGAKDIIKRNQHRVWNSLGTVPFLQGELDSTTQALSQVIIPIIHAQARAMQLVITSAIEFGLNLHLRLQGISAQAWLKFEEPKSPFILDEARAEHTRMQTDKLGADLFGPAWAQRAMRRWDIDETDAEAAPAWWNPGRMPVGEEGGEVTRDE